MAYDEHLAERIRAALATTPDVSERKMFGGLAFMVAGHMACGIVGDDLMLRLGETARTQRSTNSTRARWTSPASR